MSESGVVTPEAVVLQLRPANLGSRIAAYSLDFLMWASLYAVVSIVGVVLYGVAGFIPAWVGVTLLVLFTLFIALGWPVLWETLWNGRTPGKAVFGLRVVTIDGAPVRFRHGAIRWAVGFLEILGTLGLVGSIALFIDGKGRRLGDHAAGTVVLRERTAQVQPRSFDFTAPSGAEAYVDTLDASQLRPHDYAAIRQFLIRSGSFDAGVRMSLATELGNKYRGAVDSMPPSWLTAEGFLLCLATAYQRRFSR